jgi:hypothetical protein
MVSPSCGPSLDLDIEAEVGCVVGVPSGDGQARSFLADGDTITIRATAPGADGVRIGLGEVVGTILPAANSDEPAA